MTQDPNGFISFADYMGLNDGAGQEMLRKTLAAGAGKNADPAYLQKMAQKHTGAAWDADSSPDAQFQREGYDRTPGETNQQAFNSSGEAVRQGTATYAEFMKGMNDPAVRQALMERAYGGRPVSALDSALAGGSGALGAANENWATTQAGLTRQAGRADANVASSALQQTQDAAGAAKHVTALAQQTRRQAAWDKMRATRNRVDAYGRSLSKSYEGGESTVNRPGNTWDLYKHTYDPLDGSKETERDTMAKKLADVDNTMEWKKNGGGWKDGELW